jgi:hypothetical protein
MIEAYRVGVSLLMDSGITNQLAGIIAQFEKLEAVVRRVNSANASFASVIKGMNNVGAGMNGAAAASNKMSKAASDIARAMPDVTRQAEATAAAMERAASASQRLLALPAPGVNAIPAGYNGVPPIAVNVAGAIGAGGHPGYVGGQLVPRQPPTLGDAPFDTPPPGYPPWSTPGAPVFAEGAGGKLFRGGLAYELMVGTVRDLLHIVNAPFDIM